MSHMNAWNVSANILFTETELANNPQVRISFDNSGYWSVIGTDILSVPQDKATMNLGGLQVDTPDREFRRVVRHETGHTLGFMHEHQRPEITAHIDSDKAIAHYKAIYNWSPEVTRATILSPINPDYTNQTILADPNSVMSYPLPASIMKDGIAIEAGRDISASDMAFAAILYAKPNTTGRLMHTVRNADGSWQPMVDLKAALNIMGPIMSIAGASNDNGDTHFVFVTLWADSGIPGELWHLIRHSDGSWSQPESLSRVFNITIGVSAVAAAAGANGSVHYAFTTSDGLLKYTVRESSGRWQPMIDLHTELKVKGMVVALGGTNGANGAVQFAFTTSDGKLWHAIRNSDGNWRPLLKLSTELSPVWTGDVVTIAGAAGPYIGDTVFVFATRRARLWHSVRHRNGGKWTGLNDLGKGLNMEKRVVAVGGCAGAEGQTHFVLATEDGKVWHTIRYFEGGWQPPVPLDWVLPIEGAVSILAAVHGGNGETLYVMSTYQ
ncbi:hypothetical protein H8B09_09915 [Paenibacillus sp. PR3]|uniref:Peptidase M12A domain-containing protein n=2 Tax=Paenibacillus terricola TaxID=2763503 RepID=A0ABR8MSX3_9BACL|nr:hypothetical protein [Paenibacillus terricola]